jgi:hypothetical protein
MMKPLPVGLQVFENIREANTLYVDKTARILDMITSLKNLYFLSRPRRFGKTLLCSTLHAIFAGRRELFDGLAIGASDWKWKKHPVIRLDMSVGDFSRGAEACRRAIHDRLVLAARELEVPLRGEDITLSFGFLIKDAHDKHGARTVVLIDEYDNPLSSVIDNPDEFDAVRKILHDFYKIVKVAEEDLRFTFITGITKFPQDSAFSGLNNLNNITFDPRFADLCGITQEEMERDFSEYIDKFATDFGGRDAYIARLKDFYNGYRFSEKPVTLYNPFELLLHFDNGEFAPYWFAGGIPTYFIRLLKEQKIDILSLDKTDVTSMYFHRYDLGSLQIIPLLHQTGYLTIKDYEKDIELYHLGYPNAEVRGALANQLSEDWLNVSDANKSALMGTLPRLLYNGNIKAAVNDALIPFLASIPYDLSVEKEHHFQTVLHILFNMLGLRCRSEVRIAAGRIDSLVETPQYVYCFEFKLAKTKKGTAAAALAQIDDKGYLTPWRGSGKTLVKVGVSFDYKKRNIAEWKSAVVAPK